VRDRGQSRLIRFVLTGAVSNALVPSLAPLFLLSLGASPLHLGLLATCSQLDRLSRLAGVGILGRGVGKTSLMFWGRLLSMPATALLALAAWSGGGPAAVWLAILLFTLRGASHQTGNAAWWPLIQDTTAGSGLGQFMTRMRVRQRLLELTLPLAIGVYLGTGPAPERFAPLFAGGLLALGAGATWIRDVVERQLPPSRGGLASRVGRTMAVPAIRRYCAYLGVRTFVYGASFPFWVVALTERGLPVSQFVWMTSVLAGGQIVSLWFWGQLVDRRGFRPVYTRAYAGFTALSAAWLWMPDGGAALLLWAVPVFLLSGILEAGSQMAQSRAMVDAVPDDLQVEGFAVVIYASALGGGLGGLLGGVAFQHVSHSGALGLDGTVAYLAATQLAFALPWLLSRRLRPRPGAGNLDDGIRVQTS
jgi:hypothetical protein